MDPMRLLLRAEIDRQLLHIMGAADPVRAEMPPDRAGQLSWFAEALLRSAGRCLESVKHYCSFC